MYSFNIVLLIKYSTCEIQVHGVFMNSKYWYLYLIVVKWKYDVTLNDALLFQYV